MGEDLNGTGEVSPPLTRWPIIMVARFISLPYSSVGYVHSHRQSFIFNKRWTSYFLLSKLLRSAFNFEHLLPETTRMDQGNRSNEQPHNRTYIYCSCQRINGPRKTLLPPCAYCEILGYMRARMRKKLAEERRLSCVVVVILGGTSGSRGTLPIALRHTTSSNPDHSWPKMEFVFL